MTNIMHNMREFYMLRQVEKILDKHFPGETRPSLIEMEQNAVAAFGFTHPLFLDGWRPTSPNYVHLGMMNVFTILGEKKEKGADMDDIDVPFLIEGLSEELENGDLIESYDDFFVDVERREGLEELR